MYIYKFIFFYVFCNYCMSLQVYEYFNLYNIIFFYNLWYFKEFFFTHKKFNGVYM